MTSAREVSCGRSTALTRRGGRLWRHRAAARVFAGCGRALPDAPGRSGWSSRAGADGRSTALTRRCGRSAALTCWCWRVVALTGAYWWVAMLRCGCWRSTALTRGCGRAGVLECRWADARVLARTDWTFWRGLR